jgi:hypothetical protein
LKEKFRAQLGDWSNHGWVIPSARRFFAAERSSLLWLPAEPEHGKILIIPDDFWECRLPRLRKAQALDA